MFILELFALRCAFKRSRQISRICLKRQRQPLSEQKSSPAKGETVSLVCDLPPKVRESSTRIAGADGALRRFTVTSGSRTKALISVPGRQVPNCRFKGVYQRRSRRWVMNSVPGGTRRGEVGDEEEGEETLPGEKAVAKVEWRWKDTLPEADLAIGLTVSRRRLPTVVA